MNLPVEARASVDVILGDPAGHVRSNICSALRQQGFTSLREYARLPELKADIATASADLLVIDVDLPGGDVFAFIEEIRRDNLTANPFMVIMATTWDARTDVIRRAVGTGADDLLAKPVSVAQLLHRIEVLCTERKPFVVTSDYIGPDRRAAARAGENIVHHHVPNTLKAKLNGRADPDAIRVGIERAQAEVNDEKLRRNVRELARLVGELLPVLRASSAGGEDVGARLQHALGLSKETAMRLRRARLTKVGDMCRALVDVLGAIAVAPKAPHRKDLDLLEPLSNGLLVAIDTDRAAADKTGEIAASVSSFTKGRSRAAAGPSG